MIETAIDEPLQLIRPKYFAFCGAALLVMTAAIVSGNVWFLNWVHVMCGVLWTGVDLFMGFVLGPILRGVDLSVRRQILLKLTPRTLYLMPTVSTITGTAGWFLAAALGLTRLPWPSVAWIYAALALVTIMTAQGLGYLLPTNLRVCLELRKAKPDGQKIARMMSKFFYVVAVQGVLQVATIVVMARIVTGI